MISCQNFSFLCEELCIFSHILSVKIENLNWFLHQFLFALLIISCLGSLCWAELVSMLWFKHFSLCLKSLVFEVTFLHFLRLWIGEPWNLRSLIFRGWWSYSLKLSSLWRNIVEVFKIFLWVVENFIFLIYLIIYSIHFSI